MALKIRALRSRDIATAIALRDGDVDIVSGERIHPSIEAFDVAIDEMLCLMPSAQAEWVDGSIAAVKAGHLIVDGRLLEQAAQHLPDRARRPGAGVLPLIEEGA